VVAERDLPYEVPEPEYVEVDPARLDRLRNNLNNSWGDQIPIALCIRCGLRYTEDPNRDPAGEPIHEDPEDDLEVVCTACSKAALGAALREDMVEILDETLGLGEVDRRAIRAFIETVFTDPKKILQVQDLDNRVRDLEKQNNRLWVALGIEGGLLGVLIAALIGIALALAF
jgi:hypothetical protein